TTIDITCNDYNGYSVYAVGYGNDTEGITDLIGQNTGQTIPTGTNMTTSVSNWAMRLTAVDDSTSYFVPTILSDANGSFAENHAVPSTNTKVVTFQNAIDVSKPSRFTTTYAAAVTPYQVADTYTGQVKYTLVHPNYADSNGQVGKYYMQDLNSTVLANLLPNVNNTIIVYDKRDEQPYKIAKLADGKYWMVENLNLAGGTTITSADSDVTEDFTLPASSETGFDSDTKADGYVYNTGKRTSDCTNGCYSYYSYNAATAGTGVGISSIGNAPSSICPKGWRLPIISTSTSSVQSNNGWKSGDSYALATAYGVDLEQSFRNDATTAFFDNAGPNTVANFLLNGYYYYSKFRNGNSEGVYSSSTSSSSTGTYVSLFKSSSFMAGEISGRTNGAGIRCIFDHEDVTDITTMQEMTPTIAAYTPQGTTATLTDSRGGVTKSYTVAKLADNKVWMTSNLDLPGGTTITPADSDVTESCTLPASATKNTDNNNLTDATQFSDDNTAYVFNSGNNTNCGDAGQNIPCGSYYSYLAATAGTGASLTGDGVNATGSICPKGWRLPTATTSNASATTNNNWKTGDFYALATAYGANLESNYYDDSGATGANFYTNAGPGTTPGFLLAGYYNGSTFSDGGSIGRYGSSTSISGTFVYYLSFNSWYVHSADNNGLRRVGYSVRCLANS
ncbi:hypothetical protein IJJ39_00905, partial [Candidatus Saccharibacteria bacterium]|nr:hypothetical protein [Candidatus Saccharibacteria bacterium]